MAPFRSRLFWVHVYDSKQTRHCPFPSSNFSQTEENVVSKSVNNNNAMIQLAYEYNPSPKWVHGTASNQILQYTTNSPCITLVILPEMRNIHTILVHGSIMMEANTPLRRIEIIPNGKSTNTN